MLAGVTVIVATLVGNQDTALTQQSLIKNAWRFSGDITNAGTHVGETKCFNVKIVAPSVVVCYFYIIYRYIFLIFLKSMVNSYICV